MAQHTFTKDPDAVLDYQLDWSDWLVEGDWLASSEWDVPDGVTKDADSCGRTSTTIWLSGGTNGRSYALMNRVVTEGGRTADCTVRVNVEAE